MEKFVGDAVMAVFGAPTAHGDDPERAVRAALAVRDAVAALNAERPELELRIRGAVNTGEAVVTLSARPALGEAMVAGDVVNTASRLQQHAPVGEIVVGEETYRATRAAIEYEPVEPVTAKGKATPIEAWRAVDALTAGGRARPVEHAVRRTRPRARSCSTRPGSASSSSAARTSSPSSARRASASRRLAAEFTERVASRGGARRARPLACPTASAARTARSRRR